MCSANPPHERPSEDDIDATRKEVSFGTDFIELRAGSVELREEVFMVKQGDAQSALPSASAVHDCAGGLVKAHRSSIGVLYPRLVAFLAPRSI